MTISQLRPSRYFASVALILATASLALGESPSPEGEVFDPLTLEGPLYSVWIPHQTECCPKIVELRVRKEGWEEERSFEMSGRIETLQELQPVIEPRLLVVGELRYGGTNLWIANLETLEQEAEIWNYGYGVSPSGRFLAYQTHYPGMTLPDARRSIFLLYDLTVPPEDNRSGAPSNRPEPKLGVPIFPKGNARNVSWSIFESERSYELASPFLWSADESTIVFLVGGFLDGAKDRQGYIVRVDLTPEGGVQEVRQDPLSLNNLDLPHRTASLEEIEGGEMLVSLETIEWAEGREDRWVVGTSALPGDTFGSKIWIRVP